MHGHTNVPTSETDLWHWVDRQRRSLRKQNKQAQAEHNNNEDDDHDDDHDDNDNGDDDDDEEEEEAFPPTTAAEEESRVQALNQLGFDWAPDLEGRAKLLKDLTLNVEVHDERWTQHFNRLCAFKEEFGHFVLPPNDLGYQDLSAWARHQRFLHKRNRLQPGRVKALDEIGFAWTAQQARWDIMYEKLVRFHAEHGHTKVPTRYSSLYRWTQQQRQWLQQELTCSKPSGDDSGVSKTDTRFLALEKLLMS